MKIAPAALLGGCAIVVFVGSPDIPAFAQEKTARAPAPADLLGKTFEQCEKVLGKPALVKTPFDLGQKQTYYIRFYKSSWPGISRIILSRVMEMKPYGAPPPKTVNEITYEFPKGTTNWQKAFTQIGISSDGVQALVGPGGTQGENTTSLSHIAGRLIGYWFPAEDESNPSGQFISPHPGDDCLDFNPAPKD